MSETLPAAVQASRRTRAAQPGAGGRGGIGASAGGVAPGTYTAKLTVNGLAFTEPVQVLEDRWINER